MRLDVNNLLNYYINQNIDISEYNNAYNHIFENQKDFKKMDKLLYQYFSNEKSDQDGTVLYHQTSFESAFHILKTQEFKRGSNGLAGPGIYFATKPENTNHKARHKGVILKANVCLGKSLVINKNGQNIDPIEDLYMKGYASAEIPRNGTEYVVYETRQILSIEIHDIKFEVISSTENVEWLFKLFDYLPSHIQKNLAKIFTKKNIKILEYAWSKHCIKVEKNSSYYFILKNNKIIHIL
jgi:co-chaperonin GroES (HSP10)